MKKMNIFSIEGLLTLLATLSFYSHRSHLWSRQEELTISSFFLMVMLLMTLTVYKRTDFRLKMQRFARSFLLYVGGGFSGILFEKH